MPDHGRFKLADRIRVELIEADIEQAFGLVDMAEEATIRHRCEEAERVLIDADRVMMDIDARLAQFTSSDAAPFLPLIAELRRALDTARSHMH